VTTTVRKRGDVDIQHADLWRAQRVLVTGGAGFIGSHLVDALVAAGARVRVLDNLCTGRRENLAHLADAFEFVAGDLRDRETCRRAAEGVRWIFHQAALGSVPRSIEDPATTIEVNVSGTANLFTAARDAGVERIVYASSSSVYGDSPTLPKREGEQGRPLSPYAASKVQCEELAEVFGRCFGMELVGLRYFNIYGPRQDPEGPYAAVVPRFFTACAAGQAPLIYGDGEQARDFTFIADAVAANLLAAAGPREACGRAYNIGAGTSTTVLRLAEIVRELAGGGPKPEHAPGRAGDVRFSLADISAARQAFGYVPRTSLAVGLERTAPGYLGVRAGPVGGGGEP